ncbi:hypothetical protein NA57DRAFT_45523 [Rhizodiscina lignyota]|uniref:Calcineurin-like phosphoesterase domain-containing protein n=1 Tax=Rhizodiscina lignyota TaxID=1504668 RepID=A0A9P4I881_9PEZI|nr:hypothetical protein NA57DRAFT_45523 [Rhizodiscina lignyota]
MLPLVLSIPSLSSANPPSWPHGHGYGGFPHGNGGHASKDYGPAATTYVAPAGFPTSIFSAFYSKPVPTQEPQPKIFDPVLKITFPYDLTNPKTIPTEDHDPVFYPKPKKSLSDAEQKKTIADVVAKVKKIINAGGSDNCTVCKNALVAAQPAAFLAPSLVPEAMVDLCISTGFHSNESCIEDFAATNFGAIWTQVLFFGDMSGLDGNYVCNSIGSFCPRPATTPLDTSGLFPKPKPKNAKAPKPSGKRVKVSHLSDFHIDPRYFAGSEANCTTSLCCRANGLNANIPTGQVSFPAPLFGAYHCDTPMDLGLAALQAVGPLTGTSKEEPFAWSIYTGDLVSHDPQPELSRAYAEYAEVFSYEVFKRYINGPIFPALGNHDSNPEAIDAPHSLPGKLGQQQSWNYDHVAGLWQNEGWIDAATAAEARAHYGAYSVKNHYGLRIITFNTDFWYRSNFLNFINTEDADNSGMFKFLIDELQAAEDAGERVWILGHVLSGWDGSNPIDNPTDLFYQIVERYSPHVIANIFFGHTHEDQFMIYYANNGTVQTSENALATGWICPSVVPLTNLNTGFRMYEVDTGDFNIYDAYTFYADVNSFSALDDASQGPTFKLEYSTRDTYGPAANWPKDAPLNATFWHAVTEAMEKDLSLVTKFNTLQGKSSVQSPTCTNEACQKAKICYMRSGSAPIGSECPQGYGSVQSAFNPPSA